MLCRQASLVEVTTRVLGQDVIIQQLRMQLLDDNILPQNSPYELGARVSDNGDTKFERCQHGRSQNKDMTPQAAVLNKHFKKITIAKRRYRWVCRRRYCTTNFTSELKFIAHPRVHLSEHDLEPPEVPQAEPSKRKSLTDLDFMWLRDTLAARWHTNK